MDYGQHPKVAPDRKQRSVKTRGTVSNQPGAYNPSASNQEPNTSGDINATSGRKSFEKTE